MAAARLAALRARTALEMALPLPLPLPLAPRAITTLLLSLRPLPLVMLSPRPPSLARLRELFFVELVACEPSGGVVMSALVLALVLLVLVLVLVSETVLVAMTTLSRDRMRRGRDVGVAGDADVTGDAPSC